MSIIHHSSQKASQSPGLSSSKNVPNVPLDNSVNNTYNEGKIFLESPQIKQIIIQDALRKIVSNNNRLWYVIACKTWALRHRNSVGIVEKKENDNLSSYHWNSSHLGHCRNVWLCPECRSFILNGRCREVTVAYTKWKEFGFPVWMLTLTVSHSKASRAVDLIPKIQSAYTQLRNSRAWREMWKNCGSPTGKNAMVGNYEYTFGVGGIHPHRHILMFFQVSPSPEMQSRLIKTWCKVCSNVGLVASSDAQNFKEIHTRADYVSKIGWELCDTALRKEGRGGDRLSFYELCKEVLNGKSWAISQLEDYVRSCFGLRALHWSKGLKKYFNVTELNDDEIIKIEANRLKRHSYISRDSFYKLGDDRGAVLTSLDVSQGVFDEFAIEAFKVLGIDVYDVQGQILIDSSGDNSNVRHLVSVDARRDLNFENKKKNELFYSDSVLDSPGVTTPPNPGLESELESPIKKDDLKIIQDNLPNV